MRRLLGLARRWRDRRGSSIVEFALLSPIIILLICGGIELGHFYMAWMTLEGATLEAARTAATTQETNAATREATMRATITRMMAVYPVQAGQQIAIQVHAYTSFTNAGTPEPFIDQNGNGKYDGPDSLYAGYPGEPFTDKNGNGVWDSSIYRDSTDGGTGDVVSYTATFPAAYYFTFLQSAFFGMQGVTLHTTVVTRNEPVVTTASSP